MTTEQKEQAPTQPLSGDPAKALQEMMDTIDSLRTVYEEETDALIKVDTMRFLQLQERKIETAATYQSRMEQTLKRREEMKKADPSLRERLLKKQEEFAAVADTNLKALDRMRNCVQRLSGRIMSAARRAAVSKNTINYSAGGSLNGVNRPVSIGINESA